MNQLFFQEYYPLLILFIISFVISALIFVLSYLLAIKNPDTEKLTTYECGFDPYEDARNAFDVRFYLVAILFIIFDLEAVFLFPWGVSFMELTSSGFWGGIDFLVELCLGFVYAWKIGALEW
jgi:NADH-quinone oxidoreductase subunit A